MNWAVIWSVIFFLLHIVVMVRALTRAHRAPASRLAWIAVIMGLPGLGIVAYFFFGDPSASTRMDRKLITLRKALPKGPLGQDVPPEGPYADPSEDPVAGQATGQIDNHIDSLMKGRARGHSGVPRGVPGGVSWRGLPPLYRQCFARAAAVNGFQPMAGNRAELTADSDEAIDWLVADIEAAREHAHLLFYIWLPDNNGTRVAQAMMAAARRGVKARVIVDGLGSRKLLAHKLWKEMIEAGVDCVVAFDISYPVIVALYQRLDIRNHRKIVVIDHDITYVGSQNCADPAFLIKAKYAPWVDTMLRIRGPVAWQAQRLFIGDWMAHGGGDIAALLERSVDVPAQAAPGEFIGVMAGTGSVLTREGVPDMVQMLLASAQEEVVITTPYYVPSEALHQAICSAAKRGIRVRINLPGRNDSRIVGMAAKSYFDSFLAAGVEIHEFHGGLLHAKLITVDGQVALVGSANLDRRSFDLNFENALMLYDPVLVGEIRDQQRAFIAASGLVDRGDVANWSRVYRLLINAVGTLAPLL